MIRELEFQNQELREEIRLVRENCNDLRTRVNEIPEVPPGVRWYAVARGRLDGGQFVHFVTTSVDMYHNATEGVWKPVVKSFDAEEEAQDFLL